MFLEGQVFRNLDMWAICSPCPWWPCAVSPLSSTAFLKGSGSGADSHLLSQHEQLELQQLSLHFPDLSESSPHKDPLRMQVAWKLDKLDRPSSRASEPAFDKLLSFKDPSFVICKMGMITMPSAESS